MGEPNGPHLAPAPMQEEPWSLLLDCSSEAGGHKQPLFLFSSDCFVLTFKPLKCFLPNSSHLWRFQGQVSQDMVPEGGGSSQLTSHRAWCTKAVRGPRCDLPRSGPRGVRVWLGRGGGAAWGAGGAGLGRESRRGCSRSHGHGGDGLCRTWASTLAQQGAAGSLGFRVSCLACLWPFLFSVLISDLFQVPAVRSVPVVSQDS